MTRGLLEQARKCVQGLSLTQVHAMCMVAFGAAAAALATPLLFASSVGNASDGWLISGWPARFCANLIGYATVLLPLQLIVWLAGAWGYARRAAAGSGLLPAFVRLLAVGSGPAGVRQGQRTELGPSAKLTPPNKPESSMQSALHLAVCFLGLQAAYLTWGVLQERMMTFDYDGPAGQSERFRDSQFLVFANRALGGFLALPLLLLTARQQAGSGSNSGSGGGSSASGALGAAPAFEFVYSSLSNILSSWCQYEALVYVTFPTQVLAKASKIIPVMLMGKLVSRKTYRTDEYFTSGLISAGTALFLLSSSDTAVAVSDSQQPLSSATLATAAPAVSGALLLTGYLVFDAFTSSWQSRLFVQYRVTSLQMMAGSSLVSCLITVAAQLQQGSLAAAVAFAGRHPQFAGHLGLLSLCSTLGQLVIYHTIDRFGPVTFIIIMTVRQAFAILISCLLYQHQLSGHAWLGLTVVFGALFLRIHFANRATTAPPRKAA